MKFAYNAGHFYTISQLADKYDTTSFEIRDSLHKLNHTIMPMNKRYRVRLTTADEALLDLYLTAQI